MNSVMRVALICGLAALSAACTTTAGGPAAPAAAAPPGPAVAAAPEPEPEAPPLERHEASAQCWMKYDKAAASLDAKAKLVDKCIDEKMRGGGAKR